MADIKFYIALQTCKTATGPDAKIFYGEMNYLQEKDQIVLNRSRLIAEAKQAAIDLADNGYTQPKQRADIKVQGKTGIALLMAGIAQMQQNLPTALAIMQYFSYVDFKPAQK